MNRLKIVEKFFSTPASVRELSQNTESHLWFAFVVRGQYDTSEGLSTWMHSSATNEMKRSLKKPPIKTRLDFITRTQPQRKWADKEVKRLIIKGCYACWLLTAATLSLGFMLLRYCSYGFVTTPPTSRWKSGFFSTAPWLEFPVVYLPICI